MAKVYRSSRAEADLTEIWNSIGVDDRAAADRQLERVAAACEMLAENPYAGKARSDLAEGLRFYPAGNYLISYVVRTDGIAVARFLHGARDYRQDVGH